MATERLRVLGAHLRTPDDGSAERGLCAGQRVSTPFGPEAVRAIKARFAAWERYLRRVPDRIERLAAIPPGQRGAGSGGELEPEYDVVVAGFGAAGAAAALEAAAGGARVLLLDRYGGGGSTQRSGGIVYGGGGTAAQRRAGVSDSPENMFSYLRKEAPDCIEDSVLRAFCDQSRANIAWLEGMGVRFADESGRTQVLHGKSSYPPSHVTLYNSGNEEQEPWRRSTRPAMRGHRPFGQGLTGHLLFAALEGAVAREPRISVALHSRCVRLLHGHGGGVTGCVVEQLPAAEPAVAQLHAALHGIGSGSTQLDPTGKVAAACMRFSDQLFARAALPPREVRARGGVVLCCGGFFFNRSMVERYAPRYRGMMALGNIGDDGAAVEMGLAAGGIARQMDRASAWKFLSPPSAFIRGVLVSPGGERVANEDLYGATLADRLVQLHGGRGWLLIDAAMHADCTSEAQDPASDLDSNQRIQAMLLLGPGSRSAASWAELARKCGAPGASFGAAVARYNEFARAGEDADFGKRPQYLAPLQRPPFYAVNMSMVGNRFWPTPCMTLGGLAVDGASGLVLRSGEHAGVVRGLYAAGRSACGVASNYYLSGLSIADCIFSGRRAGKHAARGTQ